MQVSFQCKKHTGAQKDGYLERQGELGLPILLAPMCFLSLLTLNQVSRDIAKEIMEVLVTCWRQKGTGESASK